MQQDNIIDFSAYKQAKNHPKDISDELKQAIKALILKLKTNDQGHPLPSRF